MANSEDRQYHFGEHQGKVLEKLEKTVYGNGKMGMLRRMDILQWQVGLLMLGVGYLIVLAITK